MGNLDFIEDRENIQPVSTDFTPIPPGRYRAFVSGTDLKATKNGDGLMLVVTHDIDDDEYRGRKIFTNLNIKNASEKAQAIGRGQLSSLARACGKTGIPEDSASLHDIPHLIKVGIEQSLGYEPKNVVKGFYKLDSKAGVEKVKEAVITTINEDDDLSDIPF